MDSQDFRTWQVINNIRGVGKKPSSKEKAPPSKEKALLSKENVLSLEEKALLVKHLGDFSKLNSKGRLSWKEVRNLFSDKKINYTAGADEDKESNTGILGNRTGYAIWQVIGEKWNEYNKKKTRKPSETPYGGR